MEKFTFQELIDRGLYPIIVKTTVTDPDEWYFTKYPDGLYWPSEKREPELIK